MHIQSLHSISLLIPIFHLLIFTPESQCQSLPVTILKETKEHYQCNGNPVTPPPTWFLTIMTAASNCVEFANNDPCFRACIAYNYPGLATKGGKLNMAFIRKESRSLELGAGKEYLLSQMMEGIEECNRVADPVPNPQRIDDVCIESKELGSCLERKYKEVCMGKKKEDFLDELD